MEGLQMNIGIFICTCNNTIEDYLDTDNLASYVKELPNVTFVETNLDWCNSEALTSLSNAIKAHSLDRVVFAGCSPQFIGTSIEKAISQAGLSKGQLTYANIREHCAWVHSGDPVGALNKSKRLVRSAVFRVTQQKSYSIEEFPVAQEVLVLGAGVAGIQASKDLAARNIRVHLVERTSCIGGHMVLLVKAFARECSTCGECMEGPRIAEASTNPNIHVYTNTQMVECKPAGKNFDVTLIRRATFVDWNKCTACNLCLDVCPVEVPDESSGGLSKRKAIIRPHAKCVHDKVTIDADHCLKVLKGECGACAEICPPNAIKFDMEDELLNLRVGSIILATGFDEFDPSIVPGLMYGQNPDVITQMQLSRMMSEVGPTQGQIKRISDGKKPKNLVMIQCVGARDARYDWQCHKYCCISAIEHAAFLKQQIDPEINITILCRDIRSAGRGHEEFFIFTRDVLGVNFVYRGDEVNVKKQRTKTFVEYLDPEGQRKSLPADLVVLSCAMKPPAGTEALSEMLNVPLDSHGFFQALDEKVALTRTSSPGIFLCGTCHSPKLIIESVGQASAAALEAAIWLSSQTTQQEMNVATVNKDLCNGCGLCLPVCTFAAISMDSEGHSAVVDPVRCHVCGQCFGICPVGAITPLNENQTVLDASVNGLVGNAIEGPSPLIVGYACQECCYRTIDQAGENRLAYPANIHILKVPCTGSISSSQILRTLIKGADGVVLYACDPQLCHYGRGVRLAENRVALVRQILDQLGISPHRVQLVHMFGREPQLFVDATHQVVKAITTANQGKG
jgi:heterodisulfide reductase subunit A